MYRALIAQALEEIVMPAKTRLAVIDRIEPLLIEAVARGRRLARVSMRTRRRTKADSG